MSTLFEKTPASGEGKVEKKEKSLLQSIRRREGFPTPWEVPLWRAGRKHKRLSEKLPITGPNLNAGGEATGKCRGRLAAQKKWKDHVEERGESLQRTRKQPAVTVGGTLRVPRE